MEVGNVRKDVVRMNDIRALAARDKLRSEVATEELALGGNAALDCDLGNVPGRFDAEHANTAGLVELEQISIIARSFNHEALRTKPALLDQPLGDRLRMLQHGVAERREVDVIAKQRLRRDGFGELH